ncbi:MAG: nickel pincer cofactor biosynthesis protein LarC [Nitrospinales bacterium]
MRVAYFDCYSGISGDMILGALVDLGVDLKAIKRGLGKLDLRGYRVKYSRVKRGLISGAKVDVIVSKSQPSPHSRRFSQIKSMIEESGLPDRVKTRSVRIFKKIAQAEAEIHQTTIGKVHFHEIGAVDSIVDIVGGVLGLELLDVDAVMASPLNTGEGSVLCDHGLLPVPAPATLKLLQGIPCYSAGVKKELTTPTGAAIIGTVAERFASMPMMKILASGYGAGDHLVEESPNMLRIILGEMERKAPRCRMIMVETNIDDMNPEFYDYIMQELFDAGAADVFFTPIIMKKNRPAVKFSVLVPEGKQESAARLLLSETSTFGVRFYEVDRMVLDREPVFLKTPYGRVKVKVGKLNGAVAQFAPEYEECRKIAKKRKIPLKKVYADIVRMAEGKL